MTTSQNNQAPLADSFREIRSELLAYLSRYVGDPSIAEDILHETFIKALTLDKQKTPNNMAAWLFRVAKNTAIDHFRKTDGLRGNNSAVEAPSNFPHHENEENTASKELASCLRQFTEHNIPEKYADTLIASQFNGQTLQQIADDNQVTLSAIKSRASRGRKLLKEKLLQCCEVELSQEQKVLSYKQKDPNNKCC